MTFGNFGDPVDPAYVSFREGLENAVKDSVDHWRLRWNPMDKKWFTYAAKDWVFEDLGIPDTSPEGAVKKKEVWPTPVYEVESLFLRALWERLEKAATSYRSQYPGLNLVWSPWGDGDWRSALRRWPEQGPAPGDKVHVRLPPRALEQIKEIKEWQRRGYISADQAQKMINEIIAGTTPDA